MKPHAFLKTTLLIAVLVLQLQAASPAMDIPKGFAVVKKTLKENLKERIGFPGVLTAVSRKVWL